MEGKNTTLDNDPQAAAMNASSEVRLSRRSEERSSEVRLNTEGSIRRDARSAERRMSWRLVKVPVECKLVCSPVERGMFDKAVAAGGCCGRKR